MLTEAIFDCLGGAMTTASTTSPNLSELAGSWVLNPARSSITFHTKAMWLIKVTGTAKPLEGHGTVGQHGEVAGTFVVDAASIDTKNAKRDKHLRTADFFEVEKYPTIFFEAASARPSADGVEVAGTLTIHGQSKPLTLPATVERAGDSLVVSSAFDLDRSAWGLTWAKMGAGLANRVELSAQYDRVAP